VVLGFKVYEKNKSIILVRENQDSNFPSKIYLHSVCIIIVMTWNIGTENREDAVLPLQIRATVPSFGTAPPSSGWFTHFVFVDKWRRRRWRWRQRRQKFVRALVWVLESPALSQMCI